MKSWEKSVKKYIKTELQSNSTSIGKGNFTTIDGEIANYTGHDGGKTDDNGIETYKGIQIFESNPEGRLGFLDNVIGLYVYKYCPMVQRQVLFGSGNRQPNLFLLWIISSLNYSCVITVQPNWFHIILQIGIKRLFLLCWIVPIMYKS